MAYRSGTYVAFHGGGTSNPTASDQRFYRTLTMWHEHDGIDFNLVDSHEKSSAIRDSTSKARLKTVLAERLRNSRNMVLILTQNTRLDDDWVPFEIEYAIDTCEIPIIAAYPGYESVLYRDQLAGLWPPALFSRIVSTTAHVIHVPFKQQPLKDAIAQFGHDKFPNGHGRGVYSREAYAQWGLQV